MSEQSSPPQHIWTTLVGRTMFGFSAEVDTFPDRFFSFEYIKGLIDQEAQSLKAHAKIFGTILFINAFSLVYIQGIILDFRIFGNSIPKIPASSEILCLFLGLSIFGFSIHSLDVLIYSRMRNVVINKMLNTDMTNVATAHIKPGGIWVDLIVPRYIGYSSGFLQSAFSGTILFILMTFYAAIFLASATTLIAVYAFGLGGRTAGLDWPSVISTSGLVIGGVGIVVLFGVQLIPFRFTISKH